MKAYRSALGAVAIALLGSGCSGAEPSSGSDDVTAGAPTNDAPEGSFRRGLVASEAAYDEVVERMRPMADNAENVNYYWSYVGDAAKTRGKNVTYGFEKTIVQYQPRLFADRLRGSFVLSAAKVRKMCEAWATLAERDRNENSRRRALCSVAPELGLADVVLGYADVPSGRARTDEQRALLVADVCQSERGSSAVTCQVSALSAALVSTDLALRASLSDELYTLCNLITAIGRAPNAPEPQRRAEIEACQVDAAGLLEARFREDRGEPRSFPVAAGDVPARPVSSYK